MIRHQQLAVKVNVGVHKGLTKNFLESDKVGFFLIVGPQFATIRGMENATALIASAASLTSCSSTIP